MSQLAVPAVYMRGGTSRALIFHARDLPPAGAARDAIFCAAIGSPDPHRRQLNGMGVGITSLSKVAVVGPPSYPGADVDYTFGQVDVTSASVGYRGTCGNISAAIGPFAVDEGLVAAADGKVRVIIHNTNTGKLVEASFFVADGRAVVAGDLVLPGVAGSGAPIELAFLDPGGAATGRLLPTGRARDRLEVAGLGVVEVSIVDAANPVVFVHAGALGLEGGETPAALGANGAAMAALRGIRAEAAVAAGLIARAEEALSVLRNLPLVCILSAADQDGGAARVRVRMLSADQPHGATPLTGALCLAVAARLTGTLPAALLPEAGAVVVEHPTGALRVTACVPEAAPGGAGLKAMVYLTARRLMDGRVYI